MEPFIDMLTNGEVRTARGKQNIYYRQRATLILMNDARFAWLCDREKMTQGAPGAWRPGILAELGRVRDEKQIREWAELLCDRKPRSKYAVAMIRAWRLGKGPEWDHWTIYEALAGAVDHFNATHPGVPQEIVATKLRELANAIEQDLADANAPAEREQTAGVAR